MLLNFKLLIVKDNTMVHPVILGRDFIDENNLVLKRKNVNNGKDYEVSAYNTSQSRSCTMGMDNDEFLQQLMNINVSENFKLSLNINKDLPYCIQSEIEKIVLPAWCVQSVRDFDNISDDFEMEIKLTNDKPFYTTPRRLPYMHKIELEKILKDLLEKKIIRESCSPYASSIVLVQKKNKELRLCIDYRELNKLTLRDNYPLPLIEDHLDRLKDKRYFTILDLKNGFHHVKIAENSTKYTSFITPLGQYEYIRMPFGLKNAPSVFERYMKHIFGELIKEGKILTYIDDILIATETVEENLEILKEVIDIIKKKNLQLRFDKCFFLQNEISYLGYKVNVHGIRPTDDHLTAIRDFPVPKSLKDIQSFLGLCSYFRKFIRNFSIIAKPLYDLLKKNASFTFGPCENQTFELLKQKLIESPVLSIFSPNNETELHCDGSSIGFGAVLMQKQSDNNFHPIFYFSKRASDIESRYHSYELETLAIVYALKRFRIYLLGIDFKVVTDCQSLSQTLSKKTINPRISRWALELQSFSFTVEHRNGQKMMHADALSRAVNVLHVNDESFEFVLAATQRHDPKIAEIISNLESAESSVYEMVDGLVYKKFKDKILFYVPQHLETQIIRTHHEAMSHLGVEKCYEYLLRSYWFPDMKSKIKKYIQGCLKCIYFSPNTGKSEGVLHTLPKGRIPFDTVHVDHLGPLPHSKNKKKHIFVVVDSFTKFVKLYAVKTTQSKEAIVCLQSYFENYSRPARIVSDRGTCFTSTEFSDFIKANNIQHIKVATHSPQSNGQVERINRVLIPMLSKECESLTTSNWDRYLAKVEFSLNNTLNSSTGFTPSMLLFGRNQKGQFCDRIREYLEKNSGEEGIDLDLIRNQASKNIEKNQQYNKQYYDKNHKKPRVYNKGDYVMIKNIVNIPGVNKKLHAKYRGPYEVAEVLSNDRYVIKDIEGMQVTRIPYKGICAPSNMKPYIVDVDCDVGVNT